MKTLVSTTSPSQAIARSEPLTVEQIYRRHGLLVARWAMRLGGNTIDVEEVVQEVFLKVQKHLARFRGESALTTWLYSVTRNEVAYQRRKNRVRSWLFFDSEAEAEATASSDASPFERMLHQEASQKLQTVLQAMPEKMRTVFVLFELEQLTGDQIATIMNAKVETVWVWLHRARAHFKKQCALHFPEGNTP